jgi:hypothetical protein
MNDSFRFFDLCLTVCLIVIVLFSLCSDGIAREQLNYIDLLPAVYDLHRTR